MQISKNSNKIRGIFKIFKSLIQLLVAEIRRKFIHLQEGIV